ncbi:hypothetical protein K8I31_02175 [bacterium]|nr:hypothetical protein [bacterium]
MEIIAYILIGFVALCWIIAMLIGMIIAFPWGLIGLVGSVGIGLLFLKVLIERLENRDDDHYSNDVDL